MPTLRDGPIGRLGLLLGVLLLAGCPAGRSAAAPPGSATQPEARRPAATSRPDLTAQLIKLKAKWLKDLGDGHAAAVQSPFLVVIDGGPSAAKRWLDGTVLGAAKRLEARFLIAGPDKPIVVLLFSGQQPYRKACKDLLGVDDPPHFGFFRPWEQLLVMDISTGGGTLVHELTHALMAFDFPRIPDWFNEGMGSLYEQCNYEDDRLVGLVNWRLPALQKAIKDGKLASLERLTQRDFRDEQMGLSYAQTRYLCMYLQEKGLLEEFYATFRDRFKEDPTGLKFLKEIFAPKSLTDVDKEWRQWVARLQWPPRVR